MNENKKTCGNCIHCVPVSEEAYACKNYNDDVLPIELETEIVAKTCEEYSPVPKTVSFKVPVTWSMMGYVDVELPAENRPTMADAVEYAKDNINEFSLPEGEYLCDSFEVDEWAVATDEDEESEEDE